MWPRDRSPVCGPAPESRAGITEGGGNVAADGNLNHETTNQAALGDYTEGRGPEQLGLSPRNALGPGCSEGALGPASRPTSA